jgi:H+/Cl- antiporter ClcA
MGAFNLGDPMQNPFDTKFTKISFRAQVKSALQLSKSIWAMVRSWMNQGRLWQEVSGLLSRHPALQASVYWIAATASGLVAVMYSECFEIAADLCTYLLKHYPWLLFSIGPFSFVLSRYLVVRFAPAAAGSGIPHVMAASTVDPPYCDKWVGFRVGVVKILSSLAALIGGGVLGREGPTIQISAGIFYSLGKRFRHIWPSLNHQSLLIAGGAAGIAAAFNTPLGGIVYAIEELSHRNFHRFKTMLISAVIISGMVAQGLHGPYLYFGFPRMPLVTASLLPWAVAIGFFVGLMGAIFGKLLRRIGRTVDKWETKGRYWLAFAMGIILPVCAWWAGPEMLSGGSDLIRRLLFDEQKDLSWAIVVARFVAPLATYATGVAGGIFAPSLAAGAAIGTKIALLSGPQNANFIILLSMIAFLSGVTRAPFTAFVLVMEMTDRHSAIFAMMASGLVASLSGKIVDSRSFYERSAASLVRSLPKDAQRKKKAGPSGPAAQPTIPPPL